MKRNIFLIVLCIFITTNIYSATCTRLQTILNTFRTDNHINGMALYVNSPKANCYLFSGTLQKNSTQSISENNLWQIGSITKSYFAAILLQIEAESEAHKISIQFNIHQQLKQWLPQYKDWGNVTIEQLLNMTSGIYSYTELPNLTANIAQHPEKIWETREIINLAYQHQPNTYFSSGQGWHYSDTDYIIAGELIQQLIQKITGHNLALQDILAQRIILPLKLTRTFYYPNGLPISLLKQMVHGYGYYDKRDWTDVNLSIAGSAGAIISTPKDISQWITLLFSNAVLPKKQLAEMQSLVSIKTGIPLKPNQLTSGYALGLANRHYANHLGKMWGYNGGTMGYISNYLYLPKGKTIISFTLSTGDISKNPFPIDKLDKRILYALYPKH